MAGAALIQRFQGQPQIAFSIAFDPYARQLSRAFESHDDDRTRYVKGLLGLGLRFHNLGIAVSDPQESFRYLDMLGYVSGDETFDPLQAVYVAMRHHPEMPDVEVIWPGEGPSPIDGILRRGGPRIYHMCYSTDNAMGALAAMEDAGLSVMTISAPQPAVLFGGAPVSFHNVRGIGLIEIIHRSIVSVPV